MTLDLVYSEGILGATSQVDILFKDTTLYGELYNEIFQDSFRTR